MRVTDNLIWVDGEYSYNAFKTIVRIVKENSNKINIEDNICKK